MVSNAETGSAASAGDAPVTDGVNAVTDSGKNDSDNESTNDSKSPTGPGTESVSTTADSTRCEQPQRGGDRSGNIYYGSEPPQFCNVLGNHTAQGSLRIHVAEGEINVQRYNNGTWVNQYYTYSGALLSVNGTMVSLGYYTSNGTGPSGGWGSVDRYVEPVDQYKQGSTVTTVWEFDDIRVKQTVSYSSNTSQFYELSWEITNLGETTLSDVRFFRGTDTYLANGDFGYGFWENGTDTVGVNKTVNGTQQQLRFGGVTNPDGYRSAYYDTVVNDVESGDLDDTADSTLHDNAYALEWRQAELPGGESWSIRAIETFTRGTLTATGTTETLENESVNLTFTVDNTGTVPQETNYTVSAPENFSYTTPASETIPANGSSEVTVTVTPPADVAPGNYSITLTANGNESQPTQAVGQIYVPRDEPPLDVRGVSTPDSTGVGQEATVTATIANPGSQATTQPVTFVVEGDSVLRTVTRNVTVAANSNTTVAFRVGESIDTAGSYTVTVSTDTDSQFANIEFVDNTFICGASTGDPHFATFDGVAYDFQGVGEFVLAKEDDTTGDSLVVQVRHIPVAGSTSVSITNATATYVDGTHVQIDASREVPLLVNGSAVALADGERIAVGNGTVKRNGNSYVVVYPGEDGVVDSADERLRVDIYGHRIDVQLCLDPDRSKAVEGLLGSPNGNASDEFALDNGTVVGPDIDTDTLYGTYRDSWRVTENTTIFRYEGDKGPETYYFPNFPERIVTLSDLNDTVRQRAEELAIEAGLEPGTATFRDAVIDYALTGDTSYFASATTSSTSRDATGEPDFDTTVELVPANVSTANGTTVTYEVVLTDAAGGVGAYNATVAIANDTVASVTGVALKGDPDLSNTSIASDGSSVQFRGALADTTDQGGVTIATVKVTASAVGETQLDLRVTAVGNEVGKSYNVTGTTGSHLNVTDIGKLSDDFSGPPRDPDNDGVYEDINGDGTFDIVDVQALYTVRSTDTVQANVARFDVNGDGVVDIVDVQALYVEQQ